MISSPSLVLSRRFSSAAVGRVAVVGAGQMGTGIAIVSANIAKAETTIWDANAQGLEKSKAFVESWASKEVAKGRLDEASKAAFLKRLSFAQVPSSPAPMEADLAVEAVTEDEGVKKSVFSWLDKSTPASCILATNTSSIPITRIATYTSRPEKVIGMHFMNPVPVMSLVEVIQGLQTDEATMAGTLAWAQRMGKDPATSQDRPGFVANRILMPYINEAFFALGEGVASASDIDKIMKLGTNVPMGPLTLADFIGLDTCLAIMRVLHRDFGDSKYRPAPALVQHVEAGLLGKKTKRGVYTY